MMKTKIAVTKMKVKMLLVKILLNLMASMPPTYIKFNKMTMTKTQNSKKLSRSSLN